MHFIADTDTDKHLSRAAKRWCFQPGGVSRSGVVLPFLSFLSFLGLSRFSGIFPICSGMVRGFSRFVPFLFLSLLRAPTGNSPERVRDTIWTFPETIGKPPGLETPRFSFSQIGRNYHRHKNLQDGIMLFGNYFKSCNALHDPKVIPESCFHVTLLGQNESCKNKMYDLQNALDIYSYHAMGCMTG